VLLPRIVAVGVLAACSVAAFTLVLTTSGSSASLSSADVRFLAARLVAVDREVRGELVRLGPATGTAPARSATRSAMSTVRSLETQVSGDGTLTARLDRALELERELLDAVGSTLANPASPLHETIAYRDRELRRAFSGLESAPLRRQAGAAELVAYARSRSG
jgi:hypothetical protein